MNVSIPALSPSLQEKVDKYLPAVLVLAAVWLFARGLKKLFWNLFGLYWAFHALHVSRLFW
ncbi:hypothetical protein [Dokdonella sp.]|uniref:hypothetical protein n=1 Tax=Dokdonella sp. TaxID=2291710 RepID=UPI001B22D853|nr:hypothetical protein [Dokdonella sp.]MBO9663496.1 hypothetical protein [Dokdonella sp.]